MATFEMNFAKQNHGSLFTKAETMCEKIGTCKVEVAKMTRVQTSSEGLEYWLPDEQVDELKETYTKLYSLRRAEITRKSIAKSNFSLLEEGPASRMEDLYSGF